MQRQASLAEEKKEGSNLALDYYILSLAWLLQYH